MLSSSHQPQRRNSLKAMEDFNLPSLERIALLERLQEAIGGAPPHFWAACQICDLKALERLAECGRVYHEILRSFAQQTQTMAQYWGPYPKAQAQLPSSTPKTVTPNKPTSSNLGSSPSSPPTKRKKTSDSLTLLYRNQRVRNLAEQRDKSRCVLTGNSAIEVVHIYPHHSIKHKEEDIFGQRHMFWDQLRNFWPKEKIAAWQAELFPLGICEIGEERVYNLLTLSRDAHYMWGRGAFALKPILESDDKTTLEVQFFWQGKQQDTLQTMSLLTTPSSTQDLDQNIGACKAPAQLHRVNGGQIRSGDCFKLQTDDPETKPLPSFQLLELQWFLQRLQGMAGAADDEWPSMSDLGSDEEIPDLLLDEVWDTSLVSADRPSSPARSAHNDKSYFPGHSKHRTEEAGEGDREGPNEEGERVGG